MLNNVKNFVISKKEAFKMGGGPSLMAYAAMNSLIGGVFGAAIGLVISETAAVISAIKDGEANIFMKETNRRNKD